MTYMRKEERRAGIIAAAVDITLEQGLHAATARAVAARIGCAPAQIHHHFVTAAALRAEALRAAMAHIMISEDSKLANLPPDEKLLSLMVMDNSKATTLWNEGLIAAREEEPVRIVVGEVIDGCHRLIADVLTEGQRLGVFSSDIVPSLIASRLIAVCIGFDQMNVIKAPGYDLASLNKIMEAEIDMLKKIND
ncbi:TetR family transcriptional regulator [Pectobacterium aroidearum]|uniref:TetR family transcriptional regulator n=1 Tax=Pectobacterium aroidearum TaxID=1201031 RepID=UPI0015F45338|nr:TetR family transcriptional regulator [Pectobacterium aroidearum]MBA5602050.1 TetR family transcriptional regulator [Pectobacterium aroidearum]